MNAPAENLGEGGGRDEAEQGELFERHLTASFPNPNSKAGTTLRDLIAGQRLRQSQRLGCGWRLAAEVKELKYRGWPVQSWPVHVEGRKRPIAEYSLPRWALGLLGGGQND